MEFAVTKDEFLVGVDVCAPNSCWNWMRGKEGRGYGMAWHNGESVKAHRLSWVLHFGELPSWGGYRTGICVLHRCDNPLCVNPSHLFLGTQTDNMIDKKAKGRSARQLGEHHGGAKLKDCDVVTIKKSKEKGSLLAKEYSVSQATISLIRSGKKWAHIT